MDYTGKVEYAEKAAPALWWFGESAIRLRKLLCAKEQQPEFLELFALVLQKQRRALLYSCRI